MMESLCVAEMSIKKQQPQMRLLFLINKTSVFAEVLTQKIPFA